MTVTLPDFLRPSNAPGAAVKTSHPFTASDALPVILPITVPKQQLSNWCWAATTEAVQAFYRESGAKSQCEVATYWLGEPCCPPGPDEPTNPKNIVYDLQTTLEKNASPPVVNDALEFADIILEIDARRPVCCQILWSNGDRHFNLVCGYRTGTPNRVIVRDPKYGEANLPYDVFKSSFRGNGRWVASLRTRKA